MKKLYLVIITVAWCLGRAEAQSLAFRDVQPVFERRCVACHRTGDAAPFPLVTYEDVVKKISTIEKVVKQGYMPPWRADNHYRLFANERSLSENEKEKILSWIAAGAPKGRAPGKGGTGRQELLRLTAYHRKPDLTLKIDSAFTVEGDNKERFVVFKIPFELDAARPIEAVEFYCNNKKVVHHINYGFYEVADASIDIREGPACVNTTDDDESSVKLSRHHVFKKKMVYYTGWVPGAGVERYPPGFGWTLPRRGVVLVTAHYSPLAAEESSIVGINLFFRAKPVERDVRVISLGSGGIGEKDIHPPLLLLPNDISKHTLHVRTQEDQSVMYVWPHMHYLGKTFLAYAVTPEQDTVRLVHIPRWDFRWQELYQMKQLVKIPKGSVIHVEAIYDNTADNPFNPNQPPAPVFSFGDMDSKNEMLTLLLIYTSYRDGDETLVLETPAP